MNNRQKAYYVLEKFYGYKEFREGQLEMIEKISEERDSFCLLPTGGGKSVCYQIPALMFRGITLVISPLISLMKDQVDALKEMGIKGIYINSSLGYEEIKKILKEALFGEYKIIYISPERLGSKYFKDMISEIEISHIAIDEAHCVSEWGHDFRKSYREIKPFYESLKKRPVVSAFTATATKEVMEDSIKLLGLNNPYVYKGDINRNNLKIFIEKEIDKEEVKSIIREHEGMSGIIYCASRKEVDELYYILNDLGYSVLKYHAGMNEDEKNKCQEEFLNDKKDVMIATNAFGMGIDKSNIRFIVHFTMPKNLESYYQEIGRGGRDGSVCDCYLFYCRQDISRVEFLINKSIGLSRREVSLRKLQSMIDYCETDKCYRGFLLDYFHNDRKMSFCNNCSNCFNSDKVRDFTTEAQMILATVFRSREKYGISVLCDILRGIRGPKIINYKLDELTTFGIMKGKSQKLIKEIINGLLELGYVDLKEGTYSMLKLNKKSLKILKSEEQVLMILDTIEEEIKNPALYNALKTWRRIMAGKENIRPYIIFSDTALMEISNLKPKNKEELLSIRGMGEKKFEKYGEELLKLISNM